MDYNYRVVFNNGESPEFACSIEDARRLMMEHLGVGTMIEQQTFDGTRTYCYRTTADADRDSSRQPAGPYYQEWDDRDYDDLGEDD